MRTPNSELQTSNSELRRRVGEGFERFAVCRALTTILGVAGTETGERIAGVDFAGELVFDLAHEFAADVEFVPTGDLLHLTVFLGRFTRRNALFVATENIINPVISQMISENGSNSFHPHKHWVL